jgi:phosphoenolpyruvate carboxykinase (ATP)
MSSPFNLHIHGIQLETIVRNASPATLYEEAIKYEKQSGISRTGALIVSSGKKTGRSPNDKRVVKGPESEQDIWWGQIMLPWTNTLFRSTGSEPLII